MAEIPPVYEKSDPGTVAALENVVLAAIAAGEEHGVKALAVVVVFDGGLVTAGFAGESLKESLAPLLTRGPEVLRVVIERALAGHGKTTLL